MSDTQRPEDETPDTAPETPEPGKPDVEPDTAPDPVTPEPDTPGPDTPPREDTAPTVEPEIIDAPAPAEPPQPSASREDPAPADAGAARPRPADAVKSAVMKLLPEDMGPYLSLSRFDRPVGFWLLALPCFIGLAFARIDEGWRWLDPVWLILFGVGAIAMRGAGCTFNDIQDRKVDAQVERTRGRPLPSGQLTVGQAWMWLGVQLAVGFLVWACLPGDARIVALLAIPLVAAYPFMKRLTWWPQAWLGLTFNWGVLVAAATAGSVNLLAVLLYLGLALWTVAYDTIYAVQDREDDALVGVKSTARLFAGRTGLGVFAFFAASAALVGLAGWIGGAGRIGAIAVLLFFLHGTWQVLRLKRSKEADALPIFRSNVTAGLILFIGFALSALLAYPKREAKADKADPPRVEAPANPAQPRVYDPLRSLRGDTPARPRPWWMPEAAPETPQVSPQAAPETAPVQPQRQPQPLLSPAPAPDAAPADETPPDAGPPDTRTEEPAGLFSRFYKGATSGDAAPETPPE